MKRLETGNDGIKNEEERGAGEWKRDSGRDQFLTRSKVTQAGCCYILGTCNTTICTFSQDSELM